MDILNSIVRLWLKQIDRARKDKWERFGKTADRAWGFLGKGYKDLYIECDDPTFPDGKGAPYFKVKIAKSREYVNLMLPYLHHKIPHRQVTPDRPPIPPELIGLPPGVPMPPSPMQTRDQMLAWMLHWWLNYLPRISGLADECRLAIPEALVKGRGVVWHEMMEGPTGFVPCSTYDSVDNLLIDPDSSRLRDAGYTVRIRRRSLWRISEEFEIPREQLKSAHYSNFSEAAWDALGHPDFTADLKEDEKGDVGIYYEVYSRMGIGNKFFGADEDAKKLAEALGETGDNVWLCVMPGVPYPLNLPPWITGGGDAASLFSEIQRRIEWPIKFYGNPFNPWAFSPLDFYPNTDNCWATSPLEAALPLQAFLDHAYSFLMSKVRTTCRDLIITSAALDEDIRTALIEGLDQEVVTAKGEVRKDLSELAYVLQFPAMNGDLMNVISMAERAFERQTGLDPLLYGGVNQQMRSAQEAFVRQDNLSNRPDDMAQCTESWQSLISAKEAAATRMHTPAEVVSPLFGGRTLPVPTQMGMTEVPLEQIWTNVVNTPDENLACSEVDYTVEAGSGRRKNKQKMTSDAQALTQTLLQPMFAVAQQTGNTQPFNALLDILGDALDIDMTKLHIQPPPPPPMQAPPQGPPPEQGPPQPQGPPNG